MYEGHVFLGGFIAFSNEVLCSFVWNRILYYISHFYCVEKIYRTAHMMTKIGWKNLGKWTQILLHNIVKKGEGSVYEVLFGNIYLIVLNCLNLKMKIRGK